MENAAEAASLRRLAFCVLICSCRRGQCLVLSHSQRLLSVLAAEAVVVTATLALPTRRTVAQGRPQHLRLKEAAGAGLGDGAAGGQGEAGGDDRLPPQQDRKRPLRVVLPEALPVRRHEQMKHAPEKPGGARKLAWQPPIAAAHLSR